MVYSPHMPTKRIAAKRRDRGDADAKSSDRERNVAVKRDPLQKTKIYHTPYTPRPSQREIHLNRSRYRVVVAHRRFGKTTAAINELIADAFENPGRYWYIAPTYRQAKTIAYDLLLKYVPPDAIVERHKNELTMKLVSGSEIALKGVDNEDSLRGAGLKGVVMDECQDIDKRVWDAVVQPMLLDTKGWAMFLGTPKGRNFLYELFLREKSKKNWKSFRFNAYETEIYPSEEIDEFKESLPEDIFRQEYLAEFVEGEGSVFRGLSRVIHPKEALYEEPRHGEWYQVGVDLARVGDWSVLTVVDRDLKVRYFERFQEMDWELQKLKIAHLSAKYNHARVVIDATTYGDPIAQDLMRMGVNVVPFRFTNTSKKHLIENLQLRIEQNQVQLPDDENVVKELEAFTFEYTSAKNIRYNAPKGFHDDCVISIALAMFETFPAAQNLFVRHRETLFTPPIEDNWG